MIRPDDDGAPREVSRVTLLDLNSMLYTEPKVGFDD
jgi:hypothetical protein